MLGLVGQKLGPYIVRQVATMGGVAVIYRGEHEALHNAVAIKVLTPELVEDSVRPTLEQMFLREAQILSQLRSDDILRALDHGSIASPKDGKERRVGPGSYISVPAGDVHVSGGDKKEGALFYEESTGKFDLVPVDKK